MVLPVAQHPRRGAHAHLPGLPHRSLTPVRAGLTVIEGPLEQWADDVAAVDAAWLGSKGEHARTLEFLVGEHGGPPQAHRRLFVGLIDGKTVGYIPYSPAHGSRPGWLHDLSRRLPGDTPGIMEAINKHAIDTFQTEGADWLHFGFTPFTSLSPDHETPGSSPAFTWFMHWLGENGDAVYPAQSQLAYKHKWGPHLALPEYIAFWGPAQTSALIHVFKASNSTPIPTAATTGRGSSIAQLNTPPAPPPTKHRTAARDGVAGTGRNQPYRAPAPSRTRSRSEQIPRSTATYPPTTPPHVKFPTARTM
ncbi:phosphatidylglycerol lysyltransferase domain-containing protein [Streptomyces sp. NPDC053079]|uniref:phosphatidylglycerol lysyltransferase domain-containing protein n=1 Tax=Streptomyces sp. NPDC053079 TaxID=3365697 RepID=UPI0037D95208